MSLEPLWGRSDGTTSNSPGSDWAPLTGLQALMVHTGQGQATESAWGWAPDQHMGTQGKRHSRAPHRSACRPFTSALQWRSLTHHAQQLCLPDDTIHSAFWAAARLVLSTFLRCLWHPQASAGSKFRDPRVTAEGIVRIYPCLLRELQLRSKHKPHGHIDATEPEAEFRYTLPHPNSTIRRSQTKVMH